MGFGSVSFVVVVLLFLLIPLMIVPIVIAKRRKLPHKNVIALVSILGTVLFGFGWLIALIWSLVQSAHTDTAS
ncbi:hypothetical protein TDB9533_03903 [Thalassocella blandensis]|nr:hypothetical protein TDB9533_03903 [Thalassocella blandensis]